MTTKNVPKVNLASLKVAVIGAGAAGLAVARALAKSGVEHITVFEKDGDVGGVWRYQKNDVTRPMYRGLRTNLPRELMAYREKPWGGDGKGRSYVTHKEVYDYLKDYAEEFNLNQYISYGCTVTQLTVNKSDSSLQQQHQTEDDDVTSYPKITLSWDTSSTTTSSSTNNVDTFDAVCLCNGHYAAPSYPSIPLLSSFTGRTLHSVEYDDPSVFADQTVLCIGGRASGSDLAREISFHARKVYLSDSAFDFGDGGGEPVVRENVVWVPKTVAVDEEGGIHFEKSEFVAKDVDVIIFCSGYDYQFPFINDKSGLQLSVVPGERRVTPLFEQLWHAQYPTISFIGLQHSVLPFPYFELQAEAVVSQITGTAPESLPPLTDRMMAAQKDASSGGPPQKGRIQDTHYLGGYQWDYCRKMAHMAGVLNESMERYTATNKAIYDHSGHERKGMFPGGPDNYRHTGYIRDNDNATFESFKIPTH